jgi:DNA-binding beta-propeller fold protein YncE
MPSAFTTATAARSDHSLISKGIIQIPDAGSEFDHGAFDPLSRRVFVAHTVKDRLEVIDFDASRHLASMPGFPEAAGVVAEDGQVLVTNRGAAELAWIDAHTLKTNAVFETAPRPNGVAIIASRSLAVAACIGDDLSGPQLQALVLNKPTTRWSTDLPGRPRWCVVDRQGEIVYLAIREPSMVFVARLPMLTEVKQWRLPASGAHGLDIDHANGLLYAACDGGALIEVDASSGEIRGEWPLDGEPDATFFNPTSGLVHVAVPEPGVVQSIHPRSGTMTRTSTAAGAQTTALVPPDRLYVFSPRHNGALDLVEEPQMAHNAI